jgi:type I restriction-modification system DNA methylase subunit
MEYMIEQLLDLTDYATETRKERRKNNKNGKSTAEFFTPYEIVKKMAEKVSEEVWADPTKTFCEPCFGNGQFVLYIIWNRIQHGVDYLTALKTCYGVELMQDNVKETYERIFNLLDSLEIDYDKNKVLRILKKNLVCSDFFEWDFENWCKK